VTFDQHDMARAVGRIEGKLDAFIADLAAIKARQDETDRHLTLARGGLAVLGVLFSFISVPKLLSLLSSLSN